MNINPTPVFALAGVWVESMKLDIPELSDEKLNELASRIKPLVRDKTGNARNIRPVDLRSVAYTWSPKRVGEPVTSLESLAEFRCLHRYGYYGMFKPSIAEVICQIPANLIDRATHFEIVQSPKWANDLNEEQAALNAGFHVSTVRLYRAPTE